MNITQIPFNKYIEIVQAGNSQDVLELGFKDNLRNHIGTFHASAQFALAEACSGLALQNYFPYLATSVVPVLRKSDTKFKKPAQSKIVGKATIDEEAASRFKQQLENKGRGSISVNVEIKDESGNITMVGTFDWFVQKILNH